METLIEVRTSGDEPRVIAVYGGDTEPRAWLDLVRHILDDSGLGLDDLSSDHIDAALDKLRDAGNSARVVNM